MKLEPVLMSEDNGEEEVDDILVNWKIEQGYNYWHPLGLFVVAETVDHVVEAANWENWL